MGVVCAFFRRDFQNQVSYRLSFVLQILGIFPIVLMFFFLSRLVDGNEISGVLRQYGGMYFPFVLIGISIQNYLTMAMNTFSASIRDSQLSGTLEAIMATPVSVPAFLAGSTAYSFVFNSFRILIYFGFGLLLFHFTLEWSRIPLGLLIMILTITAFSSLGIFSASFIIFFKKGDPVNWLVNVASWLLGGVYYPVAILPEWLQKIAFAIPMTHTLESFRLTLLGGQGLYDIRNHMLALLAWTVIGLPLSCFCFNYALNRSRRQGTIGHY